MTLGQQVRSLRNDRGLSQEQLAAKANVTHATVSRIERGAHEGTMRTIRKLAKALGVKPQQLIGGTTL
jgi:transcriptional regulator with XRE-family HTH domain